jgi:anti-sigma regulatory factor (Ser/Thr protein kinase)
MKKFRLIITSFVLLVAVFYLSSCDKVEDEILDQNFVIDTETREVNFGEEVYLEPFSAKDKDGKWKDAVITVTDKGPGIPDIEKALQEGWSTAPDHVRQMGFGAGMGLPNMVKCSDKFDIQSVVGEGTTITMRFEHISEDL